MVISHIMDKQQLSPECIEITMDRPNHFSFLPGQFIRFDHEGAARDYTLTSAVDAPFLQLCIQTKRTGWFSSKIATAEKGAALHFTGPLGHFIFHERGNLPVFVATGSGIAPFVAFCRNHVTDFVFIHGVKSEKELIYKELMEKAARTYVGCISRFNGTVNPSKEIFHGRVTAYIKHKLKRGVYDFYLCGKREMIHDAIPVVDRRFEGSRIFTESFG